MECCVTNFQTFVVFTMDAVIKRWWQPFLEKPFYHCLIIQAWEEDGKHMIWIRDPVVDFSKWDVSYRDTKPFEVVHWWSYLKLYRDICMRQSGGIAPKIVKTEIFLDKYKFIHTVNKSIPLCTMFIKIALGITNLTAITPKQVYELLRKKYGGKNVFI